MTDQSARAALDAIVKRDQLTLIPEEYERLVGIYTEARDQLAMLRGPEFQNTEPATLFRATGY